MAPVTVDAGLSWSANKANRLGPFEHNGNLYGVFVDAANNHVEVWTSTNSGSTWAEADSGNHKSSSAIASYKVVDAVQSGSTLHILYYLATGGFAVSQFSMATDSWGTTTSAGPTGYTSVSGTVAAFLAVRSDGSYVLFHQTDTQGVMGTQYRRVAYSSYASGTWTNDVSVDGLGTGATHADARMILIDQDDRAYFVRTQLVGTATTGALLVRPLSSTNTLGVTATADGTMDADAFYAVGHGTSFTDQLASNRVVFSYVDTDNILYSANRLIGDSGGWFVSAITSGPDISGSNPASIAIDGTTTHIFFTDAATNDLWRTSAQNLGNTYTWGTAVEFQDAVSVQGLSIGKITNGIGTFYQNGTTITFDAYLLTAPPINVNVSDSGTISPVENLTIEGATTRTDSGTIGSTEALASAATTTRTDSGTIGVSESFSALTVAAVNLSDSGTLTASESFGSVVTQAVNLSDSDTMTASESLASAGTVSLTDTDTLVEASSFVTQATYNVSDSGTLAATEDVSQATTAPLSDTGSIGAVEDFDADVTIPSANLGIRTIPPFQDQSPAGLTHNFTIPATTAGDTLVAFVSVRVGSSQTGDEVITDNGGNTWTLQVEGVTSGLNARSALFTCTNANSITSLTVTSPGTTNRVVSLTLFEIVDADAATMAFTAGTDSVSDTTWDAGTITPDTGKDAIVIHGVNAPSTGVLGTFTPPSGYSTAYQTGTSTLQAHGSMWQEFPNHAGGSVGGNITTDRTSTNAYSAIVLYAAVLAGTPVSLDDAGTLGASESLSIDLTTHLTIDDTGTLAVSDTLTSATTITLSDTATLTAAEALTVTTTVTVTDTDTLAGAENWQTDGTVSLTDTDTLTAAEALTPVTTMFVSLNDSGTLTGTDSLLAAGTLALTDTDTLSESSTFAVLANLSTSDNNHSFYGLETWVSSIGSIPLADADTLTITESLTTTVVALVNLTDSATLVGAETLQSSATLPLADDDTIGVVDTISGASTLPLSDAATLSEVNSWLATAAVALTDTDTLSEVSSLLAATSLTLTDLDTFVGSETFATATTLEIIDSGLFTAEEAYGSIDDETAELGDVVTISVAEAFTITTIMELSDNVTVSVVEALDVTIYLEWNDEAVIGVAEDFAWFIPPTVFDQIGGMIQESPVALTPLLNYTEHILSIGLSQQPHEIELGVTRVTSEIQISVTQETTDAAISLATTDADAPILLARETDDIV